MIPVAMYASLSIFIYLSTVHWLLTFTNMQLVTTL
uniref:Uncharacterized protein n=1 Tax=Arundo donax TaxID=35708 RepID=A0A0A9EAL4_ARUDO